MTQRSRLRELERVHTSFNEVSVCERDGVVSFEIAGATHAEWHPERLLTRQAWDALAAAALLHPSSRAPSLLMLGLGGGTGLRILRTLLPSARMTVVEIDPGMIALGRKYMGLDALDLEIVEADAFAFQNTTRRTFDVVIDDLYLSGETDAYRPAPMNDGGIGALRRLLAPGGILAVNLITGPGHRAVQSDARASLRRALPVVATIRPAASLNETVVAGAALAPLASIAAATARFAHPQDRQDWLTLRVRKLARANGSEEA